MTNILVGSGVSSPLYILLSLFDIPLLIYFYHSYQTISEFLRQGQYSIIIYHSTIVIKIVKNDCEAVHCLVKLQDLGLYFH